MVEVLHMNSNRKEKIPINEVVYKSLEFRALALGERKGKEENIVGIYLNNFLVESKAWVNERDPNIELLPVGEMKISKYTARKLP